ncbi:hypothetical protein LUZ61_010743 [Rhynchospora tenuis]|uniref:RBR-type E3 ubiquitin transferase n=1 Tax=Rhynchospora tenuis TaxID=198213 RepID=A0AAD6EZX5_9POAL|nr:hypothetical protein LUZ61_010743 [Rhynchospora tenuis]
MLTQNPSVLERKELGERSDVGWQEVVNTLAKLRTGDESEISEETIRDNHRRQDDEVVALEAIYQDNLVVLNNSGGLRSFQIVVQFEALDSLSVSANFDPCTDISTPGTKADDDTSDEGFLYSFKVKYLPPIILNCILPKSYPSHHAPCFTISAPWLNKLQVSSLSKALDSIWREQIGEEVIFQWTEWLHNSSLAYLGYDEGVVLVIPDDEIFCTGDDLVTLRNDALEKIIHIMMSYNEERCHDAFLNNAHQCLICYNEFSGLEFIKLPCQHFFCSKCMETYAQMLIKEGSVTKLSCPSSKCEGHISPMLLKRLLDDQDYERWESLLLQRTLDTMSDVVYCPRCQTACLEDSNTKDAQCSECLFSFCTLCKEKRHLGEKCMDIEAKLRALQERSQSSHGKTKEQIRMELELINEAKSMKEVQRVSKPCPNCKIMISHTGGCNKMVCSNCGQFFCYRCNKSIKGYDHFRDDGCQLFPGQAYETTVAVPTWEARMNDRQMIAQIQAERSQAHKHPCPNCHQLNIKINNNNHIFCWSCQLHFCGLCRKTVKRSSEHFKPTGCKQHTSDP